MKPHMTIAKTAVLCGSSFPMGFNMGVLYMPLILIREWIKDCMLEQYDTKLAKHEEYLLWATVVSTFLVGAMIGALNCSSIVDKIGRRRTFLLNHMICLTASLLFIVSVYVNYIEVFVMGRFLSGICSGIASSLVPIYLSEFFPCKCLSNVIHALAVWLGISISVTVGTIIALVSETYWNFLPVITLVGSAGALLAHPFIIETQSYNLLNVNNEERASNSLQEHRTDKNDITTERHQLKESKSKSNSQNTDDDYWDLKRIWKALEVMILLLNVVILCGALQLFAINDVEFTLPGISTFQNNLYTILYRTTNWIMCMASFLITRKYLRRKVILIYITGFTLSLAGIFTYLYFAQELIPYITLISLIISIISISIGLGALPYIFTVELIPEVPHSLTIVLGASVIWVCNLSISTISNIIISSLSTLISLNIFMLIFMFRIMYLLCLLPEQYLL